MQFYTPISITFYEPSSIVFFVVRFNIIIVVRTVETECQIFVTVITLQDVQIIFVVPLVFTTLKRRCTPHKASSILSIIKFTIFHVAKKCGSIFWLVPRSDSVSLQFRLIIDPNGNSSFTTVLSFVRG